MNPRLTLTASPVVSVSDAKHFAWSPCCCSMCAFEERQGISTLVNIIPCSCSCSVCAFKAHQGISNLVNIIIAGMASNPQIRLRELSLPTSEQWSLLP